jgi:hypothetical protein
MRTIIEAERRNYPLALLAFRTSAIDRLAAMPVTVLFSSPFSTFTLRKQRSK